jgi:hypothetical protein
VLCFNLRPAFIVNRLAGDLPAPWQTVMDFDLRARSEGDASGQDSRWFSATSRRWRWSRPRSIGFRCMKCRRTRAGGGAGQCPPGAQRAGGQTAFGHGRNDRIGRFSIRPRGRNEMKARNPCTLHHIWSAENLTHKVKTEIPIDILHRRLQEKCSCVKCKPLRIKVSGIRPSSWSHASQWSNAEVARGLPREAAGL